MADNKNKKYVVVRGRIRVSDSEYDSPADAADELSHWKKILQKWPDGTTVEIVEKDDRKHRIW